MGETGVTWLLSRWREGDQQALEKLTPLIYRELRHLAGAHLRRERNGHTLQPTALVNEAYLKLAALDHPDWQTRAHFLAAASRLMRQVLVDHARKHHALKRGPANKSSLEAIGDVAERRPSDILALEAGLSALARIDPAKSRMIELRFFGGLTGEEIAHVMGVSTATVTRNMRMAEAWLALELKGSPL